MDALLLAQFQRVEAALGTLVDSIAAYNPSPQAALDLVAADEHLSHGLDAFALHQANHSRILALRAEAHALESQLTSSVAVLADLRRELFQTPATTFSDASPPVPFDELLQFANNISKHTVPPTYRERIPRDDPEAEQDKANDGDASAVVSSNGLGTPAIASAPVPAEESAKQQAADGEREAPNEVTAEQEEWLMKLNESQLSWYPWPSDQKIRIGNLMAIQHLLDQGKRPEDIDISEVEEEEKKRAEEDQQKQEAAFAAQEPQMPARESVAPTSVAPRPAPEQPAIYEGFDDFDDD
ncbi:hypothetical protein K505DRAFT_378554 [Melanomma pulvis-pyrius CBS 109.77]|uniref:Mediator of RNA polymerase II transcription subunit 4 n=1 Tax=Melanomma pulvis-pyrius CBS 109.77 TaxID=1314802 RepID=A0A6A6WXW8_9PLEO|nr:hypothetical protein K505DRAFT_378554 [Melanomma pulvis-pyrius CBS 109.77]